MGTEDKDTTQTPDTSKKAEPGKKANRAAPKAHVAFSKGKSADKASPGKQAPKGHKKAVTSRQRGRMAKSGKQARRAEKAVTAREGSKAAQILELLKRPGGATLQQIMKVSQWQPHSVRGFISGMLRKKMGLAVESTKGEDGQRTYSLEA